MNKEKTTFQVRDLRKRLNRALKKKQQLNKRIMKAIEYIKINTLPNDEDYMFCMMLLDILKGEDKE